mgnify:CR=1 FL=1
MGEIMTNKKLLFGIFVIVIVAIAGVSLFYHLKDAEFTIAWELPFIQERKDKQPSVPDSTPTTTPSPKTTPAEPSHEQSPIPSPKGGEYLYFRGGEKTKVFLIDSNMRYGTYDEDIFLPPWPEYSAKKGDPCVIINGTIRNEYDKDYFICLTADIYNVKGEKVGTVITNATKPFFTVVYSKSNGISPFEIHIKYDKKDIIGYDIFVAFEPSEIPPP